MVFRPRVIGNPFLAAFHVQSRQVISYHLEGRSNVTRRLLATGQVGKYRHSRDGSIGAIDQRDLIEGDFVVGERRFYLVSSGNDLASKDLEQRVQEVRTQRP